MALESLLHIQKQIKNDLLNIFGGKLLCLVGYGSFFMQETELDPDKKPDFIVVVEDYSVYHSLGKFLGWSHENIQENMAINQRSINFYNLIDGEFRLKIGIVSKFDMEYMLSEESEDIYLSGRLSKKVFPVFCKNMKERLRLESLLEKTRKKFVEIAFELQKGNFTIDDILRTYLAISYMAEFYRYATIDRKKPEEILEKTRNELLDQLAHHIQEYAESSSLSSGYLRFKRAPDRNEKYWISKYLKFLKYSIAGARHSFHNRKTNKFSNDSSSSSGRYVLRKIKNMLSK